MMTQPWAHPCKICGHVAARVMPSHGGWHAVCDVASGGCGATGPVTSNHAQAIDRWNYTPSPGAVALTAAAARRLGAAQ